MYGVNYKKFGCMTLITKIYMIDVNYKSYD